MYFVFELIFALYVISFVWFWSLCQMSIPEKTDSELLASESNLIPFERGVELQLGKMSHSGLFTR